MKHTAIAAESSSDVTLLLEGTYPYVRGGVSSWVHQIIRGLPELRFALVFIGGQRKDYGEMRYELPDNVVRLDAFYLEDALRGVAQRRRVLNTKAHHLQHIQQLHQSLRSAEEAPDARLPPVIASMLGSIERPGGLSFEDFLFGAGAFEFIRDRHMAEHDDASFVDYFWTLRLLHGPIFQLARIADQLPPTRLFHAVSTGYAGLLGALLKERRGTPLVLTEHGIYTKERRIDLNKAEWIEALRDLRGNTGSDPSQCVRELWTRYFENMGRMTYAAADPIISLYEGNRRYQMADGALAQRTQVIVNGIDVERFESVLRARPAEPPQVVGLIGRVVPIKDIKTFIRAMQQAIAKRPVLEGWIIGGEDEDPGYAAECHAMVDSLGLGQRVRFLGHQDVGEMLPKLGAVMLTSISEAQPLSVLEAFAAGVPCITTDVGACREQIEGRSAEDRALGVAGRVVPFADAKALAEASLWLLGDVEVYRNCQRAALSRVRLYYSQADMIAAYDSVYRTVMEA